MLCPEKGRRVGFSCKLGVEIVRNELLRPSRGSCTKVVEAASVRCGVVTASVLGRAETALTLGAWGCRYAPGAEITDRWSSDVRGALIALGFARAERVCAVSVVRALSSREAVMERVLSAVRLCAGLTLSAGAARVAARLGTSLGTLGCRTLCVSCAGA